MVRRRKDDVSIVGSFQPGHRSATIPGRGSRNCSAPPHTHPHLPCPHPHLPRPSTIQVNIQALELLGRLFAALRERVSLGLNTLVPALAANLGSANDKIRAEAVAATDTLLACPDPALLLQVGGGVLGGRRL